MAPSLLDCMNPKVPWAETVEGLRARAQWYRDWAEVCSGDNAVFLHLAEHFDGLAEAREAEDLG